MSIIYRSVLKVAHVNTKYKWLKCLKCQHYAQLVLTFKMSTLCTNG